MSAAACRRLARRVVLAGSLAALSACVTVEGTLKADGSGTLEIVYHVLPTTTEKLEKERFASPQVTLDSFVIKPDDTAVAKLSFDDPAKLKTVTMLRDVGIERHREGDEERLTVTLTNDIPKELKEEGKPGPKFTFKLPGKVLEANRNATVEGDTVSWHFTLAEYVNQKTVDLTARYQVTPAGRPAPAGPDSKRATGAGEPAPPK